MKPYNYKGRKKRYKPNQEWWLNHVITEGIKYGLYERPKFANNKLSDWNFKAYPVIKDPDSPDGECRITFDYSPLLEDMPGLFLELMTEVTDYISLPEHTIYMQLDLKNAHWSIGVHPDGRHMYAFYIPGIGQLQPTRMPQGSRFGWLHNERVDADCTMSDWGRSPCDSYWITYGFSFS